ncbi:hypothetical protein R1sor_009881 [Riccia sorocarpa]|uniref:Amino acid transporter n=1 Tax=Riccia sorocarpa TaxID=122646 RepID=A0ABD3HWC5_9MARC
MKRKQWEFGKSWKDGTIRGEYPRSISLPAPTSNTPTLQDDTASRIDQDTCGSATLILSTGSAVETVADIDPGERRLNELGYKQELKREVSLLKCVGFGFSTVGLFAGILLYGPSFAYTGPVGLVWGWFIVSFFTGFIGLALAEICSSFSGMCMCLWASENLTTGSLYFWTAHLAGPRYGPFASWVCAWLEIVGLIAGAGTQAYSGAQVLQYIVLLSTGTNKDGGYFASRGVFYSIYFGFCLIWAILNTFALKIVAMIDVVSLYWQVVGGALIIILVPSIAPVTQSAKYVFTHYEKSTELTGIHSNPYALVLSLLFSQFALLGYDAPAHLTEETKNADRNGPMAILVTTGLMFSVGCGVILSLTFSIQDPAYLFDPLNETGGGFVAAQILYDAFYGRYGSGTGAVVLLCVYALSRDGGTPGSRIWKKLHPIYKVPANAVWLSSFITALIGLPVLGTNVAFTAIVSVSSIGWMGSYAIPIFLRMIMLRKNFTPGPFHLGKASRAICAVAFLWICYSSSVFLLPTLYPLTLESFNYAPVALGVVLSFIMSWWILDARKWFSGPVRNIIVDK